MKSVRSVSFMASTVYKAVVPTLHFAMAIHILHE